MKIVKITSIGKRNSAEYYDIRLYKTHSEQIVVKKYFVNSQRIKIKDE